MTINLPFVMEFVVYLTNRCNLRCEMCSQYGENYKENSGKELRLDEWMKFFHSISDVNPKPKIILMGGEPLLYKDFDKLLAYLTSQKFPVHLVTNGVFLDKHLDAISKSSMTITVSIDGLEETHDRIRGFKGTFKKAIENIGKLNNLKNKGADIRIFVNSVLLPDNVDEIGEFLKYIQTKGVEQVVFQHLQFSSEELNAKSTKEWQCRLQSNFDNNFLTKKHYVTDKAYVEKLKTAIAGLSDVCDIVTFIFPYLTDEEMEKYYLEKDLNTIRPYIRCSTPWITAFIGAEGNVSNCIENMAGNILENNFWEIWNSEKATKFRRNLCECGNFEICAKCCNFYKSGFLFAKECKISVGGRMLNLPAELNYVKPAPEGVFVLDERRPVTEADCQPVFPIEVHSQRMLDDIKSKHKILGYFSEIDT